MENNMSDIINKFNTILKDKNINFDDFTQNLHSGNNEKNTNNKTSTSSSNPFTLGNDFDISTLIKFKNIFDKTNNTNSPRNQLLYSLKPFLRENKQEKLEQFIKIANVLYILNFLNENGDKK